MSNSFELEGAVVIHRLRTGQTVYLSLDSDKPLFQAVDTDSGAIAPDFTVAANQPTVTPTAKTYSGEKVTLSDHHWKWNGNAMTFDGAADGSGFKPVTSGTGKGIFKMNPSTGQLKIVGNIASKDNYANDTLTYSGDYEIATSKLTGNISKDMTIPLQKAGASSYIGMATPLQTILDANTASTTINTMLMYGVKTFGANEYTCKWYKGSRSNPINGSSTTLTVNRDMVNGQTLFICDFLINNKVVATDGCSVTDMGDVFRFLKTVSGDLDDGKPVTVRYVIIVAKTQKALNVTKANWEYKLYRVTSDAAKSGDEDAGNESANDSDYKPVVEKTGLSGDTGNPGTLTFIVDTADTEKGDLGQSDVTAWAHAAFEATL